jgi:cytochrome c biogenesis protein CcmG/thiol:disulfide interchange protein DsbE
VPILAALPLVVFLALGGLFMARLGAGDASRIPSALIGQAAPKLDLPGLDGGVGLTDADVRRGRVTLVNIFASWCQPCHIEHEFLLGLASDPDLKDKGVAILGVAQKDSADNIRRFLNEAGDPYAKVGLDSDGRAGIDWGVYGVPETFIVNGAGIIAYKFVGPMNAESIEKTIKPEILKAMR